MPSKSETLAQAIEHHMAGRFDEAERLYLTLHQHYPEDEEVLYLLGILVLRCRHSGHRRAFSE